MPLDLLVAKEERLAKKEERLIKKDEMNQLKMQKQDETTALLKKSR